MGPGDGVRRLVVEWEDGVRYELVPVDESALVRVKVEEEDEE